MKNYDVTVGDLYPAGGGTGPKFWMLLAIKKPSTGVLLGLDVDFNVVSGQNYGLHYLERKKVVGHINIEDIVFRKEPKCQE